MVTGYLDNFYARLGIPRSATKQEVRSAYHEAARKFHPDTNKDPGAMEVFLQIQEAFETLSNAEKRAVYDERLPEDIDTPEDILVSAIYSREVLPIIDSPQLVYVLLNLVAVPDLKSGPKLTSPPLNICLVLDTSTSMSGRRLEAVQETAITIVQSLKPQDILSVVTFSDRAEVIIPATRGQNVSMIEARISIIHTSGGTEIGQGLQTGLNEITHNLNPGYHNNLILITDGRTYGDEENCLEMAGNAAKNGVTISCLGIGNKWNDEFLDTIASKTGGSSAFAANPKKIKEFLKAKFGQIQNTFANNIILNYTTPPNVELRYAFRLSPEAGSLKLNTNLPMGDIPLGKSLSVLMEFMVETIPEEAKDLTLTVGDLQLTIPSLPIPNTSSKLSLSRVVAKNPKAEPPPQVLVKAMSRLSLYRMQELAKRDLDEGNIEKATQRLKNLATQLLSSGQADLAHTVMIEMDAIERTKNLSEAAQKRIKYGTRALVSHFFEEPDL